METALHRQLKLLYAGERGRIEAGVDGFRIDVARGRELIEIQHGSLAALKRKVLRLLESHRVRIVKPIIAEKTIIKLDSAGGRIVSQRKSPKRGTALDLFHELVYFTGVYPHPRLTIEVVLVEVVERRYPGHGRRRRWRQNDFEIEEQRLVDVRGTHRVRTAADLLKLLAVKLPQPFHTGHLAEQLGIQRGFAQRIAYCLRHAGAARQIGKQGNAALYEAVRRRRAA